MIRQVTGSSRFFYIVRDASIEQYAVAEETRTATWDLPSPPRSPLLISSCNDAHWSIVCEHHLRTHDVSVPHDFVFDDAARLTFVAMHEIGIDVLPPPADCIKMGVRLAHVVPPPGDVRQQGDDVHVRHLTNSGFVQIIAHAHLVAATAHGVIVHDGVSLVAYDRFGLHPRPLIACAADRAPLATLLRPTTALLGNWPAAGEWQLIGGRWHVSYYTRLGAALFAAGVLLRIVFAF